MHLTRSDSKAALETVVLVHATLKKVEMKTLPHLLVAQSASLIGALVQRLRAAVK
jgi:hypothetical protein